MKLILLISSLLIFYGCDIFSTRDAEKPTEPATNLPQAFERETLINNFILSHQEKTIFDYMNCFSDSLITGKTYIFEASSEAASQFPALMDWNLRSEENYFRNIIAETENTPITLILSNPGFSQQGDSVIYTSTYSLTIPFTDPGIPQNYQGDLIFHMFIDQSLIWKINYWQDFKSGDSPSWSELKGRFAN